MISIVIPAKDEERAIFDTIKQIQVVLKNTEFEILVVDDGSDDETAKLAISAGARVISHPHNLGYGAALKTGIQSASSKTIVITDADGTYPIDQILTLLNEFDKGYDMVVGARTGKYYRGSILKRQMRLVLKLLVEFSTGRSVPDVNSGLRVFSREKAIAYFSHLSNSFSFTTSITLAFMMNNLFVKYISISYSERTGETKVHLLRDSFRTLQYIIEAIVFYNPLKLFGLISISVIIGSIANLALALVLRLSIFYFIGIGGLLISAVIFCLGLVAVLLKQIMIGNN